MHSEHFYQVKEYYDTDKWSIDRVRNAVIKGWITEVEFFEITGKEY